MQTQVEQGAQLETTLSELMLIQLDERQRLQIMAQVFSAIERLSAQLHHRYLYHLGQLTAAQLEHTARLQSLYYLSILVYDVMIKRLLATEPNKPPPHSPPYSKQWQQLLTFGKK